MVSKQTKYASFFAGHGSETESGDPKILEKVGYAISSWTVLENELFRCLVFTLFPDSLPSSFSPAYHSVRSVHDRLDMVASLPSHHAHPQKDKEYLEKYRKISNKIKKLSKYRAKVAHGALVTTNLGPSDKETAYWVPFLDVVSTAIISQLPENRAGMPKPEFLTAEDLSNYAEQFIACANEMKHFVENDIHNLTPHFKKIQMLPEKNGEASD